MRTFTSSKTGNKWVLCVPTKGQQLRAVSLQEAPTAGAAPRTPASIGAISFSSFLHVTSLCLISAPWGLGEGSLHNKSLNGKVVLLFERMIDVKGEDVSD